MPYKFNNKVYTLAEKHPMTKERFEASRQFIEDNSSARGDEEALQWFQDVDKVFKRWKNKE